MYTHIQYTVKVFFKYYYNVPTLCVGDCLHKLSPMRFNFVLVSQFGDLDHCINILSYTYKVELLMQILSFSPPTPIFLCL